MDFPCPRCGAHAALVIGQTCHGGTLHWHESARCHQCGLVSEADGNGLPPSMIREMLIRRNGEWVVKFSTASSIVGAAKVLKTALALDMNLALSLVRTPSREVFRGTNVEAIWLLAILEKAGLSPLVLEIATAGNHRNGSSKKTVLAPGG